MKAIFFILKLLQILLKKHIAQDLTEQDINDYSGATRGK